MWGRRDLGSRPDLLRTFEWRRRVLQKLTFRDLDALDRFIPYGSGTLFDEFVSLETNIENFSTLHA